MNKDQISGNVDQVVGKIKQNAGETIGNEKLANEGVVDQMKGAVKEVWGNAKDAAAEISRDIHKRAEAREQANGRDNEARHNISQKIENVKDRVNAKIDAVKEDHREKETHHTA